MSQQTVGGGVKKVLYTLQTVQRIGIAKSATGKGRPGSKCPPLERAISADGG